MSFLTLAEDQSVDSQQVNSAFKLDISNPLSHFVGADFSGSHLGELLASSELNMSALRQQSEELQLTLALKEADEIRETVKRKSDKTPVGMPHQGEDVQRVR